MIAGTAQLPLRFEIGGRGAGAETVVLSSGLGGAARFFAPQRDALESAFHVLAYDHRGTGANVGPLGSPYCIADMAGDVLTMLDETGVARCAFVGHALGGLVGLELARIAPDRLSRLVVVNAWSRADRHTARCFAIRKEILTRLGPRAYIEAQPLFLYPATYLSEHTDRFAEEAAHEIAHFAGIPTTLARIEALLAFDIDDVLHEIDVPTLVLASRDDLLVPFTRSLRLADGLPRASLDVVAHGGHAFTVVDPAWINARLLGFLSP